MLKAKKKETSKSPTLAKLVSKQLARNKTIKENGAATRKTIRQNAAKVDVEAKFAEIEQKLENASDKPAFDAVEKALGELSEVINKH